MICETENNVIKKLLSACGSALRGFCRFPELNKALAEMDLKRDLHVLSIGKDAGRMCEAALEVLRDKLADGCVLTKYGHHRCHDARILHLEAGHPLPDQNSLRHSRLIVDWMAGLDPDAELLVLLSGGGSSLFELPKDGIDLAGLISQNRLLLQAGLGIAAVNASRAGFSRLKAGGALGFFSGRKVRVFALSDVEGDDPSVIASGPFTPEVPDPRVEYRIIGNNLSFRALLAEELQRQGWETSVDQRFLSGGPDVLLSEITRLLRDDGMKNRVVIMGGELPVRVSGTGKGGRCTHLALSVALLLRHCKDASFIALATDGSDNLSGVAGAWVDQDSTARLEVSGIDVIKTLSDSDSGSALASMNGIIPTGPFHANVNDVFILLTR